MRIHKLEYKRFTPMSHSTACNTTVSTKKTRPTLKKYVRKLRETLHACKENAPVSVKEECTTRYTCVCANNQAWVWLCECVSVIINQISRRQLLVFVCNESAPGSV